MERKLVSVQKIESIEPIEGADNIVKARVMGWDVVVKRGEFAPGDACVFFEIDSVLPETAAWAEFMRARKFRVKTVRLRGVLSQGLALSASILPDAQVPPVGTDVAAMLGVTKWEPVLPDTSEIAGPFPSLVPKTDEIRLQSALGVLDEIAGRDFVVTTKLDGTSITFFRDLDGAFVACTRNWALVPGAGHAWDIARRLGLPERLPVGVAIQGELCGPGIQKNRLALPRPEFFAFNVVRADERRMLGHADAHAFCAELGVSTVPVERVVSGADAASFEHSLERWIDLARGTYEGTSNRKEGIVVRPLIESRSATLGGRLSFKVINNEFLLKDED